MQLEILRQAAFRFDCRHRRMVSVGCEHDSRDVSPTEWVCTGADVSLWQDAGMDTSYSTGGSVWGCVHTMPPSVPDGCCVYTMDLPPVIGWMASLPTLHDAW